MHVIIFEDQAYTSDNKSIISSYKTDDTNIGNWQLTKYNSGPTVDNVKPNFFCVSREWRQISEKSQQSVESQILVMIYCEVALYVPKSLSTVLHSTSEYTIGYDVVARLSSAVSVDFRSTHQPQVRLLLYGGHFFRMSPTVAQHAANVSKQGPNVCHSGNNLSCSNQAHWLTVPLWKADGKQSNTSHITS